MSTVSTSTNAEALLIVIEQKLDLLLAGIPDKPLNLDEACTFLNIKKTRLYTMIRDGEIGYIERHGKLIPMSCIQTWMKTHTVQARRAMIQSHAQSRRKK